MAEFRIYYECFEQAEHYMKPLLEKAIRCCNADAEIKLVRRINQIVKNPSDSCFSAIGSLVTPDMLLTAVVDEREYPLILVEFSEAVSTEDHELQKTYGACAAFFSDAFYLKVSGQKQSDSNFGGAYYNPYSSPRIFADNMGYHGFIYDEWATDPDTENLRRKHDYLSCPPIGALTEDVVFLAVKSVLTQADSWYVRAAEEFRGCESYRSYVQKVNRADNAEALLSKWKSRWEKRMQRSGADNAAKARFWIKEKSIAAKINRFGHAMDPDRGVLIFIALVFAKTHKVYGIYALERARTKDMKAPVLDILGLRERLETALVKDKPPEWFKQGLIDLAARAGDMETQLNFSEFFSAHAKEFPRHKVTSALAYFLDGMYLGHNGPLVAWEKRKLAKSGGDFYEALKNTFGFKKSYSPVNLLEVERDANEDEVTYSLVHNVLRPCGFRIVSVSYPGAQGGTPILPQPGMGKAQKREYIDAMAAADGNILLNESKKKLVKKAVTEDCKKLMGYKNDSRKKETLRTALLKLNCLNPDGKFQEIWVGVSFSSNTNDKISWKPDVIDFMFILIDRRTWKIGMFSDTLAKYIIPLKGDVVFPLIFEPQTALRS